MCRVTPFSLPILNCYIPIHSTRDSTDFNMHLLNLLISYINSLDMSSNIIRGHILIYIDGDKFQFMFDNKKEMIISIFMFSICARLNLYLKSKS